MRLRRAAWNQAAEVMRWIQQKTVLASLLACAACTRSDAGDPPAPPRREVPPSVWRPVPGLAVEVRVSRDAEVQDNLAWAGVPSATIYFRDGTPTTVIAAASPQDLAAVRAQIQRETAGFQAFQREVRTSDGFALEYRGAAVTDPAEPLYGVQIRARIGGLSLDCKSTASSEAEIAKTVAVCRSLRAAK